MKLPGATENVQWGDNLVFKVGGKIFAVLNLETGTALSFRCSPEDFAELIEREDIVPAPYLARAYWVSLLDADALPAAELRQRLSTSYELVTARLPKKTRDGLSRNPVR